MDKMDEEVSLDSYKLYTIAWVAALGVERAAAEAMLDEEHEEPADFDQNPSDHNEYSWGRIGAHNVVIAALPSGLHGTTSAAVTVRNLVCSLPHVKIGLLVGIAGAIPQIVRETDSNGEDTERVDECVDIRLGDVVVGRPDSTSSGVVQYDLGKFKPGQVWQRRGSLNAPPLVLLSALSKLESAHKKGKFKIPEFLAKMWESTPYMATPHGPKNPSYTHQGFENDRLFKAKYNHREGKSDCRCCEDSEQVSRGPRATDSPEVHYGVIASGNVLVQDAITRDKIAHETGEKCLCYEMEAAGVVSHFPCLVIRGICDYADSHKNDCWQPYASATAAAYAKELLFYLSAKKLETTATICDISTVRESIDQLQALSIEANKKMDSAQTVADNAAKRALLSQLPISVEARYNSYTEGSSPTCLQDTRIEVLSDIFEWVDGDGARVFWLDGMAGTGKSTISRTLAKALEDRGQLAASFFFKRAEEDRKTIRKLSSTIAADLVLRYPAASTQVATSMSEDPNIITKSASEQFKSLVLKPLSVVNTVTSVVVIIDALDECDETDMRIFFDLISDFKNATLPKVKLFLTSRPDLPVLKGFGNERYEGIVLHKIEKLIVERDILVFLKHELRLIRDDYTSQVGSLDAMAENWPEEKDMSLLLNMANGLFIFAATVCRLLNEGAEGSPAAQLANILSHTTTTGHAFEATYLPVIHRQFPKIISKSQRFTIIHQTNLILGAMVVLTDPLSVPALARLVDLDVAVVEHRLNSLRSVIEIIFLEDSRNKEATQVRFLHLSFRDYLLSPEIRDVSPIWVDETAAPRAMLAHCFRTLGRPLGGLKFNICDFKYPGTPRSAASDEVINKCMPSELRYACVHMPHHLKAAATLISNYDATHQFLLLHFLHWLEALSFLKHAFKALKSVRVLQQQTHPTNGGEAQTFLNDASRFIAANVNILETSPLQIYSSALVFSPRQSIVRNVFENRYTSWITTAPKVEETWGMEFQNLRACKTDIHEMFLSPDENLIAAISFDKVYIYNIMGENIMFAQGTVHLEKAENRAYVHVAFSSDSRFVAIADDATKVQIWDIAASTCTHIIEANPQGKMRWAHPIAFVDSVDCILITSPRCAEMWCIETGTLVKSISYPDTAYAAATAPTKGVMAAHFTDYIILWDVVSGEQIRQMRCAPVWINSIDCRKQDGEIFGNFHLVLLENLDPWVVNFSGDSGFIASPITGAALFSPSPNLQFEAYTFTSNHAIALINGIIKIWNLEFKELSRTLPAPRRVTQFCYSPKSSTLAVSRRYDRELKGRIFFWSLELDEVEGTKPKAAAARKDLFWGRYSTSPQCNTLGYLAFEERQTHVWRRDESGSNGRCTASICGIYTVFSSTGQFVATATRPRTGAVVIWTTDSTLATVGKFEYQYPHGQQLSVLFFSPDSKLIGRVMDTRDDWTDSVIYLYSLETGEQVSETHITGRSNNASEGACISHDHRLLAVAGSEEAYVWEIERHGTGAREVFATSQTARAQFTKNTEAVSRWTPRPSVVEFSPDSSLLLFVRRGILEIWHIEQGVCLQRISRGYISRAAMPTASVIISDVGRLSYQIHETASERPSSDLPSATQVSPSDANSNESTELSTPLRMSYTWVGWGLSSDQCWITWNDENWLWLPLDYRPMASAVDGNSILISHEETHENWYEFVDSPKLEDRWENGGQ